MLLEGQKYRPSMTKFLNNFSKNCKSYSSEEIAYKESLFISFLDSCSDLEPVFTGVELVRFGLCLERTPKFIPAT